MLPDNTLNTALMTAERPVSSRPRVWFVPLLATLTLHAGAAGLIYLGWQPQPPPPPEAARSIKTQLVVLPSPAAAPLVPERPAPEPDAVPVAVPEPVAVSEPVAPPVTAPVAPTPAKEPSQPKPVATLPDAAAIAREQTEQQRQRELAQQEAAAKAQHAAEALAQARQQAAEREAARQRAAAAAAKTADVSSYTPLTKAAPDYPRRALSRRLEGDCTVEYTVLPDGRVSDPQIVTGACEEQIFLRPSLAAAKDFVYQPRMINGQPVAVPGVRNTFRYRLETVSRP